VLSATFPSGPTFVTSGQTAKSTYMMDAHAELSVLVASLSEESRVKVFAFFDRKMSSSYRNGRKGRPRCGQPEVGNRFGSKHGEGISPLPFLNLITQLQFERKSSAVRRITRHTYCASVRHHELQFR
jgi:hypothetical protein